MRTWQLVLAVCVLGGWTLAVGAADKKDKSSLKEKIVGSWVPATGKGMTLDFTDDGKVTVSQTLPNGQTQTTNGTYELRKNKLTVTYTVNMREVKQGFTVKLNKKQHLLLTNPQGVTHTYKKSE